MSAVNKNAQILLNKALKLHQQGSVGEARLIYESILSFSPNDFNALHLLGVITAQQQEFDSAISLIQRAIKVNPNHASAHFNLANALKSNKMYQEAEQFYSSALSLRPNMAEAWGNKGNLLSELGRNDEALICFDRSLEINPRLYDALFNKANTLKKLQRPKSAMAFYTKAIEISPKNDALNNRGSIKLNAYSDFQGALDDFNLAIQADPSLAAPHINKGNVLKTIGQTEEAISCYLEALRINPKSYNGLNNLAATLNDLERYGEAAELLLKAIDVEPQNAMAYNNLACSYRELRLFDRAIGMHQICMGLDPLLADGYLNLGVTFTHMNCHSEAMHEFEKALEIEPEMPEAHWNLGTALLRHAEFRRGWLEYEWRWKLPKFPSPKLQTNLPLWQIEDQDCRLLIWGEQGIGDEIMFSSFLKNATLPPNNCTVRIDERLIPLLSRSFPSLKFIPSNKPHHDTNFDCHLPIGSLGNIFFNTPEKIANLPQAYLKANPGQINLLKSKLQNPEGITCGISWSSKNAKLGGSRSIDLERLLSAIDYQKIRFINLQYGDVSEEINEAQIKTKHSVTTIPEVNNFSDIDGLASLISACDLVITIDNSTAHLSGALGKPTWILLPANAEWRWLSNGDTSYWYHHVKLFRQRIDGDWHEPMRELGTHLKEFLLRQTKKSSSN